MKHERKWKIHLTAPSDTRTLWVGKVYHPEKGFCRRGRMRPEHWECYGATDEEAAQFAQAKADELNADEPRNAFIAANLDEYRRRLHEGLLTGKIPRGDWRSLVDEMMREKEQNT